MGFSSFISSLLGSKTKEAPTQTARPRREQHHLATNSTHDARRGGRGNGESSKRITALPTAASRATPTVQEEELKEKRKSRGFSIARPDARKRRSWFGGQPDPDEDVPAVPRLVQRSHHEQQSFQDSSSTVRPGTATSTKTSATEKLKRFSIGRVLIGGGSDGQDDQISPPRRPSLSLRRQSSSKQGRVTVEALPPLPPMPVSIAQSSKPATSSLPADKRRSMAGSIKSTRRSNSTKRRSRSSFWASSNPDDSDSDVPPVPGLTRDLTPESDDSVGHARTTGHVRTASRGQELKQPRPLSTVSVSSRKSYVPKSAAKGFLSSTNGASDAARMSYRQSFRIHATTDLVCLTEEQRLEWAKLMSEPHRTYEQPKVAATLANDEDKFSNAQALAALEFGIRA